MYKCIACVPLSSGSQHIQYIVRIPKGLQYRQNLGRLRYLQDVGDRQDLTRSRFSYESRQICNFVQNSAEQQLQKEDISKWYRLLRSTFPSVKHCISWTRAVWLGGRYGQIKRTCTVVLVCSKCPQTDAHVSFAVKECDAPAVQGICFSFGISLRRSRLHLNTSLGETLLWIFAPLTLSPLSFCAHEHIV